MKCRLTPDASFAFAPPVYVGAGGITITRSSGGAPVPVTPNAQNSYFASADNPPAITTGETVSIAAAGGEVSAFTESVPFMTKGTIPIAVLEDVRGNRFGMALAPDATKKQVGGYEVELRAETSSDLPTTTFALVVGQ